MSAFVLFDKRRRRIVHGMYPSIAVAERVARGLYGRSLTQLFGTRLPKRLKVRDKRDNRYRKGDLVVRVVELNPKWHCDIDWTPQGGDW